MVRSRSDMTHLNKPPDPNSVPAVEQHEATSATESTGRGVAIELRKVCKRFRLRKGTEVRALEDVDLAVRTGEFVAIIGPSGCGKSTILRLIASLEEVTSGAVEVDGGDPHELAKAHRIGVAFQEHALLPWLTVERNVALPYSVAGRPVDHERVSNLLERVGLSPFARARPRQLSGGMRQRASIARAMVLQPDLLLLDEPFGALDAVTRRRLNLDLQTSWMADPVTTVLVTHDVDEALLLADRVIVLAANPGRIRAVHDVPFPRPRHRSVMRTADFHAMVDDLTTQLDELS